MIQRYAEPGLPSWPPLFMDSATGTCFISARIRDWRSVEQATALSQLIVGALFFSLIWIIWLIVPPYPDALYRTLIVAAWFSPFALVAFPLLRKNLPTLLANTLFARRLNLIFTPDAIGLKSFLYRRALKLCRSISDQAVIVQFLLSEDSEATSEVQTMPKPGEKPKNRQHILDARVVEMVIRSASEHGVGRPSQMAGRFRTIPITRIERKRGEWLVVVLNAAFEMTKRHRSTETTTSHGHDLDGPVIEGA